MDEEKIGDMLTGYVRHGLDFWKEQLNVTTEEILHAFDGYETECSRDQEVMIKLACKVATQNRCDFQMLWETYADELVMICDVNIPIIIINNVMMRILKSWLVDDNHNMCWERVAAAFIVIADCCAALLSRQRLTGKTLERLEYILSIGLRFLFLHMRYIDGHMFWGRMYPHRERILMEKIYDIPHGVIKQQRTIPEYEHIERSIAQQREQAARFSQWAARAARRAARRRTRGARRNNLPVRQVPTLREQAGAALSSRRAELEARFVPQMRLPPAILPARGACRESPSLFDEVDTGCLHEGQPGG